MAHDPLQDEPYGEYEEQAVEDWHDSDFEQPHQDPDELNDLPVKKIHIKRLSDDKVFVEIKRDVPMHWSEQRALGYKATPFEAWDFGDRMEDGSDEQGYDIEGDDNDER